MQLELGHCIERLEKSSQNIYYAENGELGKRIFNTKK